MAHLSEIVDSLDNRINLLLKKYNTQQQLHSKLQEDITQLNSKLTECKEERNRLEQECNSLKLANSMLGSDQHKRETKLKINALVREIDLCISQLSE